jgi:hypothetical protein
MKDRRRTWGVCSLLSSSSRFSILQVSASSKEGENATETDVELGLGVVPFTYSAEVFPTLNRGMFVPDRIIDHR